MVETDAEFLSRYWEELNWDPDDTDMDRLFALARRGAAVKTKPAFTDGHCEHKKAPGGCQLHNLHCGYPDCDRRPSGEPRDE